MSKNQSGFGIIEVLVAFSIVVIMIVSIGKVLHLVANLQNTTQLKTKALVHAQEPIEVISDIKNDLFACRCSVDSCTTNTCTRLSDGQSCTLYGAYTSCWTEYPIDKSGYNDFYLQQIGTVWQINELVGGAQEVIAIDPAFSRRVTIENVNRDINGDISEAGTPDFSTKKIVTTITWQDKGITKSLDLKTIITAWENL